MGSEGPRRALLLGLVEVRQPLDQLDEDGQTRMFALCHTASVAGHVDDTEWLGWHERGLMGVEVALDQDHLQVTSNDVLVSRHSLAEISAIAALQDTESHLVFVGQCQVKGHPLAVVLDMMSQEDARRLEEEVGLRLSRRLQRPSVQSSASQDTLCTELVPSAPPLTELDPSTSLPDTCDKSALQHNDRATVHASASSGPTRTQPHSTVVQPSPCSSDVSNQPSLSFRKILDITLRLKPPAANMPPTGKARVGFAPVSPVTVSKSSASDAPVSTLLVPTPLVSLPPVTTRSVLTRPVSTPPVSSSPPSTITAPTSPPLSKPALPPKPASNPRVSSPSVSTTRFPRAVATTESNKTVPPTPVFTPSVSKRPACPRPEPKPIVVRRPVSFPKISSLVPTRPMSIATAPNTAASNTPPFNKAESNTAASNTAASNTAASNTAPSNTAESNTAASNTAESNTTACNTAVSNTAVSTTAVPILPVSDQSASPVSSPMPTLPETAVSVSNFPTSPPAVSTVAADPQLRRRQSIASSSSLEEDNSSGSEKAELIFGTLNVDESEYLFIPGMKHIQEQDSSSSLEHELSVLLENERQYLDILQRIKDARSVVKSELQNLLRRNERLADFHRDLLRDLHQEFPSCLGVARVFLSRKEDLEQYRYYLMNAPLVLRQLGQQTEEVTRQNPTLEEDLKSTWKRLHYYFMTFDKLSKTVSAEEQPVVQELVDLLRDMNRQGDSAILIDGVSGAPFSLHTLGSLLLHGLFIIKDSTGVLKPKAKHHVLLFEEMMVITLPKKERYQYKDHLPIRQLKLLQANGDEATFVLHFEPGGNKKKRTFTFKSRQQESKDAWVNELSRLHLEYAKEVKRLSKLRFGW